MADKEMSKEDFRTILFVFAGLLLLTMVVGGSDNAHRTEVVRLRRELTETKIQLAIYQAVGTRR